MPGNFGAMGKEYRDPSLRRTIRKPNHPATLRMTVGWVGDIWDASELVAGNGVVNVKSTRTGVSVPHEPSRFLASSRRVSDKGLRRFCAGTIKPAGEAPPPHHHTTSSIAGLTRGSD